MLVGQHTFTASGHIHKVELAQICQWISEAWEDIPNKLIKKSFGKCCITNATDGTEDYQMWEDDNSDPILIHLRFWSKTMWTSYMRQQTDIDLESYENLFVDSDSEDFYGFW